MFFGRRSGCFLGILVVTLALAGQARGENSHGDQSYYFLKNYDYGTESTFNPLTVVINSGFDIFRSGSYQNSLLKLELKTGLVNVFDNITSPRESIRKSGSTGDFISHEIFPYRAFNTDHGHFVPNYFLHVLGEGMLYRKLEEYYHREKYPLPRLMALLTIATAQLLNETVENGGYRGANVDPIADILIFNPIGWLLFSSDAVARFFSSESFITLVFWQGQPAIDFQDLSLYNAGESYVFRIKFGKKAPVSMFNYMGSEGLTGLSVHLGRGHKINIAGGYRVVWMDAADNGESRVMVPHKPGNWLGAVFWDRNDSLLMSLKVGMVAEPTVRFNMYPGVLNLFNGQLGAFFWASPNEGFIGGLSWSKSPVGLAVQGGGTQDKHVF